MRFGNPLIAVTDLERSLDFYQTVLGLEVEQDFGANVVLTGGLSLQTRESWLAFLGKSEAELRFGGNDGEVYFEEDDFDGFLVKLAGLDIDYVHPPLEHRWGQRAVRLYDPDRHIIEVGENLAAVCRRFAAAGMSAEETAARMDVPAAYVRERL